MFLLSWYWEYNHGMQNRVHEDSYSNQALSILWLHSQSSQWRNNVVVRLWMHMVLFHNYNLDS